MAQSPPLRLIVSAYGEKPIRANLEFKPAEDRTKQSFKAECDINTIMAKYQKTGVVDFLNKHGGAYQDVRGADFQTGLEIVRQAQSLFDDLPSSVRARFENDPAQFLDFMDSALNDPADRAEAIRLGLMKEPSSPPSPAPATPPGPVAGP